MIPVRLPRASTGVRRALFIASGACVIALVVVTVPGTNAGTLPFRRFDWQAFQSSMVPFFVVAVLIERAIEVFVGIYREPLKQQLERKEGASNAALRALGPGGGGATEAASHVVTAAMLPSEGHLQTTQEPGTPPANSTLRAEGQLLVTGASAAEIGAQAANQLAAAQTSRVEWVSDTTRIANLAGGTLGIIAAFAGMRLLALLVAPSGPLGLPSWERGVFDALDVVLSAGLLGGGAAAFHAFSSVLGAFLDSSKSRAIDLKRAS